MEFTLFLPIEGANIPESHWTFDQKKLYKRYKKQLGIRQQDIIPVNFQATATGTYETTCKNTLLQMFYTGFALD